MLLPPRTVHGEIGNTQGRVTTSACLPRVGRIGPNRMFGAPTFLSPPPCPPRMQPPFSLVYPFPHPTKKVVGIRSPQGPLPPRPFVPGLMIHRVDVGAVTVKRTRFQYDVPRLARLGFLYEPYFGMSGEPRIKSINQT